MTRHLLLLLVSCAAVAGCFSIDGGFIAEGEFEGSSTVTGEKHVTLHLAPDGTPQRFDVAVDNSGAAFNAFADVTVDRSSDFFFGAISADGGFVDDVFNYASVDAGSQLSAGLFVDPSGQVSGFSFGAFAGDAGEDGVDVDLVVSVTADVTASDATLTLGRLAPRFVAP